MNDNEKTFRSEIGRARNLGSAKHGTDDWFNQSVTAIAVMMLSPLLMLTFGYAVYTGGISYENMLTWAKCPINALALILLISIAFHHGAHGMQVVVEDYVHCEAAKLAGIVMLKFFSATMALIGIMAVIKIQFGV
ncbi:MAG: succinate dehydrogenase, hydrophobic membrane anchor protein [Alphaproteobacteria bacterium]|nr:succinate dehydrogenase, hydrophobic membrane anchor protein [Alphaproteobacteria bacterium]